MVKTESTQSQEVKKIVKKGPELLEGLDLKSD